MVREVAKIEFQLCPSEAAALKHESRLLRSLKPKFNRAGVWPGKARFIVWRLVEQRLELGVVETPETGWRRFGPLNGSAQGLHRSLTRLLWLALNPSRPVSDLPLGWMAGELPAITTIQCEHSTEAVSVLDVFFWQSPQDFVQWLGERFCERIHPLERAVIDSQLEALDSFISGKHFPAVTRLQLALL